MNINVFCENNNENDFIYSTDDVEFFACEFLNFVLENELVKDFSDKQDYEFSVMLCDNEFIHGVNKEYRKKDSPTDVITFALYYDSEDKVITDNTISLGEIIISCDKVYSQAEENNVPAEYEFKNLLAHGVLHLLGFDHQDNTSLNYMLNLQNKMIESIENVKIQG